MAPQSNVAVWLHDPEKLFVNRYKGTDTDPFAELSELESLAILNAPIKNLRGLSALKSFAHCGLPTFDVSPLAGIEGLTKLEELDINTCRGFNSIEEIGHLPRLRKLHLNNDGKNRFPEALGQTELPRVGAFL